VRCEGGKPLLLSNMKLGYRKGALRVLAPFFTLIFTFPKFMRKGGALFTRETHFWLLAWHGGSSKWIFTFPT
jgi:hypothetical protein